jgi:hypothetical protein
MVKAAKSIRSALFLHHYGNICQAENVHRMFFQESCYTISKSWRTKLDRMDRMDRMDQTVDHQGGTTQKDMQNENEKLFILPVNYFS